MEQKTRNGKEDTAYLVDDPERFGKRIAFLGKGAYGNVDLRTTPKSLGNVPQRTFAVKEFVEDDDDDGQTICDGNAVREISVARNAVGRSAYLAETKGAFVGKREERYVSLLAMRVEPGVTLTETFSLLGTVSEPQKLDTRQDVKAYFLGTLRALAALHRDGVTHLDIKGNNIMVSSGKVALLDLGLAWTPWTRGRRRPPRMYNPEYRPPECCLDAVDPMDSEIREKGDVWALACVFLIAALGRYPFSKCPVSHADQDTTSASERDNVALARAALLGIGRLDDWPVVFTGARWTLDIVAKFSSAKYGLSLLASPSSDKKRHHSTVFDRLREAKLSPEFVDLLRAMLDPDPTARVSAIAAQRHRYFDSVRTRLDIESQENAAVCQTRDDVRDFAWALALIKKMQLSPMAEAPIAADEFLSRPFRDSLYVSEKAWIFFHRWNASCGRGTTIPTACRFSAARAVAKSLFDCPNQTLESVFPSSEELTHSAKNLREYVTTLLVDLDHDLDRPTPIDAIILLLYCSSIRDAISSEIKDDIGFDAFAHVLTVATFLASHLAHDAGLAVEECALDVAAPCIALGIESAKSLHPRINAVLSRLNLRIPTTQSCSIRFVKCMVREFPGGVRDIVDALRDLLRPTFYSATSHSVQNVDAQITAAISYWAASLF